MKKKISALLMCSVVILSALILPVIHATKSMPVQGEWTYVPTMLSVKQADGNQICEGEEDSIWTGTFSGTSYDTFTVIKHDAVPGPPSFVNVIGVINFEGSVEGKEGTLVIKFVGKKTGEPLMWYGTWVILSGTGELENLRGRGTWFGPSMDLDYAGKIHFDPS
jgi:hypothetical protein